MDTSPSSPASPAPISPHIVPKPDDAPLMVMPTPQQHQQQQQQHHQQQLRLQQLQELQLLHQLQLQQMHSLMVPPPPQQQQQQQAQPHLLQPAQQFQSSATQTPLNRQPTISAAAHRHAQPQHATMGAPRLHSHQHSHQPQQHQHNVVQLEQQQLQRQHQQQLQQSQQQLSQLPQSIRPFAHHPYAGAINHYMQQRQQRQQHQSPQLPATPTPAARSDSVHLSGNIRTSHAHPAATAAQAASSVQAAAATAASGISGSAGTATVVTTSRSPAPQAGPVSIQCQAGLVQPLNAALLADRYLLLDLVDGSSLYKCIDVQSQESLVCKVVNNPCINLWRAHFRLSGHAYVNEVQRFIQGTKQSYLFFAQSQGDLHSYVRQRKRLRESEARRLFRQMCEVVKSCHEQGIVLRDLKLRKFVFADADRTHLRLESLEDAVILENPAEDLLQDKRGCPAYVSPEILRVNTTYSGKAADMWSLGVILYTMLVGRYPFNDSEHATLFVKISRGQFQIPECLSSKARCMIRSLLRRDPTERIASEDLLLHPWMKLDDRRDHSPPASYGAAPSAASILYQRSLSAASDQCVPEVNFAAAEERDDDDDDADDADYNNDNHDGDEYAATPLHH